MRWLALFLAACGFRPRAAPASDANAGAGTDAAAVDAPIADAPAIDAAPAFCPADTHLRLCFSFDGDPLGAQLPDEGAAAVTAQLTNVGSIASPMGHAAQLGATSEIDVAMGSGVTNIQAAEIWFRYDSEPTNDGDRMGLYDSNVIPPNISLFFYRADPSHSLRCGLGDQTGVWDAPQLATGQWFHALCYCDGTSLHMVLDGTDLGPIAGACASGGAFVADGFTIGANNNGAGAAVDAQLLGAIDGIRLWDSAAPVASAAR